MKWPGLLNNPNLLGAVIAVLVVLLGVGLFQAVRRMEEEDSPTPEQGAGD
jgi:hypothetical protein